MKPSPDPAPPPSLLAGDRSRNGSSQLPWVLTASIATAFLLLVIAGVVWRQRSATLARQLEEMTQRAAAAQNESERWQAQVQGDSTNYLQRLTDLQAQMARRNDDFRRQKAALEDLLARTTAEALNQTNTLRKQLDQQIAQNKILTESLPRSMASTNQDRWAQMTLIQLHPTPEGPPKGLATAVWDPKSQGGLLLAENLPAPPPDLDYQLWLVDPNILSPISAGTFRVDERGRASTRFKSSFRVETVEKFVIALERKGGVPLPEGKVVLFSP